MSIWESKSHAYFIRSCVRVVSANRAGMGKTLFVTRMVGKLKSLMPRQSSLITIPVHGPVVTTDSIMQCLVKHEDTSHCSIIHLDISPSVCQPFCLMCVCLYVCVSLPVHQRVTCVSVLLHLVQCRCCGRWTLFCSHSSSREGCVTVKAAYGGTTPHNSTPLKSLSQRLIRV